MAARRFLGCLAFVAIITLICLAQDTPKGGRIEGDIRNSAGLPIAGATAQLTGVVNQNTSGVSGPDGHFVIENVPERRDYILNIHAPGYRSTSYGANGTEGFVTPFSIQNGSDLKVKITLVPAGSVSGKVVDTDGNPVTRIFVTVVNASRLDSDGGMLTNDRGEFRLTGLPDGDHYLIAERQPRSFGGVPLIADSPDPTSPANGIADVDTWFPSSLDRAGASVLHVSPDVELSGNTITLQRLQSFSLSGTVQDSITGKPESNISIQALRQEGRLSSPIAVSRADGTFLFRSLPSGTYTFQPSSSPQRLGEAPGSFARQEVLVRDTNVSDVLLVYQPPEIITGKVTVEGGEIAGAGRMSIAMTERTISNNAKMAQTEIKKDGTFEIRLSPSSYNLTPHFDEAGKGYFINKIKFNGVDLKPSAAIDVPPGNGNILELVLSKHGGKVTGTVTDDNGNPRSGIYILVRPKIVADPLSFWAHGVVSSDPNGRFQIVDLPPGEYYAATFNLEGANDLRVASEAIGRQSNGREEFTLSPDSTASVTFKVSQPRR